MSSMSQKPAAGNAMNSAAHESRSSYDLGCGGGTSSSAAPARLQAIHELIRSGDYHVPASAIADRMVERMLAERRAARHSL
jgi:anti-sigma28 factor (negative regulator of flagellin synthesis)